MLLSLSSSYIKHFCRQVEIRIAVLPRGVPRKTTETIQTEQRLGQDTVSLISAQQTNMRRAKSRRRSASLLFAVACLSFRYVRAFDEQQRQEGEGHGHHHHRFDGGGADDALHRDDHLVLDHAPRRQPGDGTTSDPATTTGVWTTDDDLDTDLPLKETPSPSIYPLPAALKDEASRKEAATVLEGTVRQVDAKARTVEENPPIGNPTDSEIGRTAKAAPTPIEAPTSNELPYPPPSNISSGSEDDDEGDDDQTGAIRSAKIIAEKTTIDSSAERDDEKNESAPKQKREADLSKEKSEMINEGRGDAEKKDVTQIKIEKSEMNDAEHSTSESECLDEMQEKISKEAKTDSITIDSSPTASLKSTKSSDSKNERKMTESEQEETHSAIEKDNQVRSSQQQNVESDEEKTRKSSSKEDDAEDLEATTGTGGENEIKMGGGILDKQRREENMSSVERFPKANDETLRSEASLKKKFGSSADDPIDGYSAAENERSHEGKATSDSSELPRNANVISAGDQVTPQIDKQSKLAVGDDNKMEAVQVSQNQTLAEVDRGEITSTRLGASSLQPGNGTGEASEANAHLQKAITEDQRLVGNYDYPFCRVWGSLKLSNQHQPADPFYILSLFKNLTADKPIPKDPAELATNITNEGIRQSKRNANHEFVDGLDDIGKFFEGVEPPDELDVGASGSSIQEVLMGQTTRIIVKRIRMGGSFLAKWSGKARDKILASLHDENGELTVGPVALWLWESTKELFHKIHDILDRVFEGEVFSGLFSGSDSDPKDSSATYKQDEEVMELLRQLNTR